MLPVINSSALIDGNFICKKNPSLSSLNDVISTNESTQFITGHVIYNPAYTYKFQLKTTVMTRHNLGVGICMNQVKFLRNSRKNFHNFWNSSTHHLKTTAVCKYNAAMWSGAKKYYVEGLHNRRFYSKFGRPFSSKFEAKRVWEHRFSNPERKATRLSITLWTELAKRGHWSAGIEKTAASSK